MSKELMTMGQEAGLATQIDNATAIMDRVIGTGDLSKLSPAERVMYYNETCKSLALNPLTRPFEYITLNGKLTLYARRDAADQLRRIHNISIDPPKIDYIDEFIIVTVVARTATGRTDSDVGVVSKNDMNKNFGNALMKAITKAKRRVTLSICGLGLNDETEVETIPNAQFVQVDPSTGEIIDGASYQESRPQPRQAPLDRHAKLLTRLQERIQDAIDLGIDVDALREAYIEGKYENLTTQDIETLGVAIKNAMIAQQAEVPTAESI